MNEFVEGQNPSGLVLPEHFADWNEEMIQRYDPEIFHHHPRGVVRWVENKRVKAVLRGLRAAPTDRVLDVGCGAGNILARVDAAERHGIDLSKFMVKRAVALLADKGKIVQGNAESLPYADASFDCVIASSLLSHVLHPEIVISELKRVTRSGGRIVISVSQEEQIEKGLAWVRGLGLARFFFGSGKSGSGDGQPPLSQVYHVDYHLHRFSLKRLRELVGFSLTESSSSNVPFVFPVHAIVVYVR